MIIKNQIKDAINHINNIIKQKKFYTACFSGYRPKKCPWGLNEKDLRYIKVKEKTRIIIEKAIHNGYHTFLCGMALGFDMMCAEIVLELKISYPHIKLIGALPCKNQDKFWNNNQKEKYKNILLQLDGIRCIYDKYQYGCMLERNKYMINNSSLVIALFDGKCGGTKNTIEYAKKQGLKIEIIEIKNNIVNKFNMTKPELETYFFPNEEIKNIRDKYFMTLKQIVGVNNFFGCKKLSDDDRVKLQYNFSKQIGDYILKDKNIFNEITTAYNLTDSIKLGEVLLHSIVIDEVLKTKPEQYDIYFDKNSILYFDNKYPLLATKNNIVTYCKSLDNILLEIKKYFKTYK